MSNPPLVDMILNAGSGGGGFNTLETITASKTWTAPASGTYRVTVIGGGGGGGKGGGMNSAQAGAGGKAGGTTSFGAFLSAYGGSGGGGAGLQGGGGGGGAGEVNFGYCALTEGQAITLTVGAGAAGGSTTLSGNDGADGVSSNYSQGGIGSLAMQGACGAPGASRGGSSVTNGAVGMGGNGAVNDTPYGYGGGGGGGIYNPHAEQKGGGALKAAGNGSKGSNSTGIGGNGGPGGPGAIFIEYFLKE